MRRSRSLASVDGEPDLHCLAQGCKLAIDSRDERAREIQRSISAVLLAYWDPLGPDGRPAGRDDEYDSYVGPVYRLLSTGASAQAIADHLSRVEAEAFGFATDPVTLLPVAEKLLQLNIRLGDASDTI